MQFFIVIVGIIVFYIVYKISRYFFSIIFSPFKNNTKPQIQSQPTQKYDLDPVKGIFFWGDTEKTETIEQASNRIFEIISRLTQADFHKFAEYLNNETQNKMTPVWPFFLTVNALHLACYFSYVNSRTSVPKELAHSLIDNMVKTVVSKPMIKGDVEGWNKSATTLLKDLSIEYLSVFVNLYEQGGVPNSIDVAIKPIKDLRMYYELTEKELSSASQDDFAGYLATQANRTLNDLENKYCLQWVSNTPIPS